MFRLTTIYTYVDLKWIPVASVFLAMLDKSPYTIEDYMIEDGFIILHNIELIEHAIKQCLRYENALVRYGISYYNAPCKIMADIANMVYGKLKLISILKDINFSKYNSEYAKEFIEHVFENILGYDSTVSNLYIPICNSAIQFSIKGYESNG